MTSLTSHSVSKTFWLSSLTATFLLGASACATPPVPPTPSLVPRTTASPVANEVVAPPFTHASELESGAGQVWVAILDGGLSCRVRPAAPLDVGKEKLEDAGIRVLDSRHVNDGRMHAMACGMPTGGLNAYLISERDVARAQALKYLDVRSLGK